MYKDRFRDYENSMIIRNLSDLCRIRILFFYKHYLCNMDYHIPLKYDKGIRHHLVLFNLLPVRDGKKV